MSNKKYLFVFGVFAILIIVVMTLKKRQHTAEDDVIEYGDKAKRVLDKNIDKAKNVIDKNIDKAQGKIQDIT